ILLPNVEDPLFDPEIWEDSFVDVAGKEHEYLVFEPMDRSHSYRIMEAFAFSLASIELKFELERALQGPKPFKRFKQSVEKSDFRESWCNYKFDAHMDWVKSQVNCHQLVG
ncbi:MAG: UPF0158 family protein, partial [Flavobacteriales bacterium]|nr:UPF0158 family protein [Flavobacteriales bacterium]